MRVGARQKLVVCRNAVFSLVVIQLPFDTLSCRPGLVPFRLQHCELELVVNGLALSFDKAGVQLLKGHAECAGCVALTQLRHLGKLVCHLEELLAEAVGSFHRLRQLFGQPLGCIRIRSIDIQIQRPHQEPSPSNLEFVPRFDIFPQELKTISLVGKLCIQDVRIQKPDR